MNFPNKLCLQAKFLLTSKKRIIRLSAKITSEVFVDI